MTEKELEKATEIYRKISELEKEIKCLQQDLEIKADNAKIVFPCTTLETTDEYEISILVKFFIDGKERILHELKKQFEAL